MLGVALIAVITAVIVIPVARHLAGPCPKTRTRRGSDTFAQPPYRRRQD